MQITRCVCYEKTFAELKGIADKNDCKTVEELQRQVEFGLNCRLCHPYVHRMLKTGETTFREILTEE